MNALPPPVSVGVAAPDAADATVTVFEPVVGFAIEPNCSARVAFTWFGATMLACAVVLPLTGAASAERAAALTAVTATRAIRSFIWHSRLLLARSRTNAIRQIFP